MRKLIGMTDFVIDQMQGKFLYHNLESVFKYAKFLKKPLEKWMFVPCDEYGNVLKEPNNYVTWLGLHESKGSTIGFKEHEKYQKSKERVLFEGFELGVYPLGRFVLHNNPSFGLVMDSFKEETIEDIVRYDLTLTQTAIKQLVL